MGKVEMEKELEECLGEREDATPKPRSQDFRKLKVSFTCSAGEDNEAYCTEFECGRDGRCRFVGADGSCTRG